MKLKKILVYILVFFIFGELLVRLDEKVNPFSKDNQVMVAIEIEESQEWKMVKANNVPTDDSTLRIMVLGDSYIHGAGLSEASKFSNLLRQDILKKNHNGKYKKCLVLDVSRPANNNLDNYLSYNQFSPIFKPQLTILAYNLNDVSNNLDEENIQNNNSGALPPKQKDKPGFVKKVYDILYISHVVQFTLHGLNDYLKTLGYIVPNSVFDQKLKAYTQNKPNWVKSKSILTKLINKTSSNDQKLMVLLMPEYDLIDYKKIFRQTDSVAANFFTSHEQLTFIDPVKYYKDYDSKALRLNKYDGHPNDKAHRILADSVGTYINNAILKEQ